MQATFLSMLSRTICVPFRQSPLGIDECTSPPRFNRAGVRGKVVASASHHPLPRLEPGDRDVGVRLLPFDLISAAAFSRMISISACAISNVARPVMVAGPPRTSGFPLPPVERRGPASCSPGSPRALRAVGDVLGRHEGPVCRRPAGRSASPAGCRSGRDGRSPARDCRCPRRRPTSPCRRATGWDRSWRRRRPCGQ